MPLGETPPPMLFLVNILFLYFFGGGVLPVSGTRGEALPFGRGAEDVEGILGEAPFSKFCVGTDLSLILFPILVHNQSMHNLRLLSIVSVLSFLLFQLDLKRNASCQNLNDALLSLIHPLV